MKRKWIVGAALVLAALALPAAAWAATQGAGSGDDCPCGGGWPCN